MDNQHQVPGNGRDEITLFDIWQILVARKWVILSMPIIALLLGLLYLLQATEIYECSARILVGQAGVGRQVENPAVIVQKIAEKYRVYDNTVSRDLPRVSSVVHDKKDTGIIVQIKTADATAKGAKQYLEQVVAEILAGQRTLFEQEMELKQTRLKTLSDRLEAVETFQQELEGRIAKVGRQDPAQATVLAVEKGSFLKLAAELKKERYDLQTEMSSVVFYPAELVGVPHLPSRPIKPKRIIVLLLAGISGLLLGIMAAFLAESICSARQRTQMFKRQRD